jgi:hypothetical protein
MEHVEVGDYLCSESDLFCVEQLAYGRAVVEDCRTGELLDVPMSELLSLARLVRSDGVRSPLGVGGASA